MREIRDGVGPFVIVPLWLRRCLTGTELLVFTVLADLSTRKTRDDMTINRKIILETGLSRRTILRAISKLKDVGALRLGQFGGRLGYSISYSEPENSVKQTFKSPLDTL